MASKHVLLIIGGGIAAYKSLELVRHLAGQGMKCRAILTEAGAQFVTPLSLAALTEDNVYQDMFRLTDQARMGHIELSRSADLVVVAPATADLMAKMAGGLANDLASTALLATDKPVLMAPAMNVRMWQSPSVQRNLHTLRKDGVFFVGPNAGAMACGEFGPGRMAEPLEIAAAIEQALSTDKPLKGVRALVTAGPTHEALDPVRFIANRSSGKQGYAIADALARAGADTVLVSGPVALTPPPGVRLRAVTTAAEMLAACQSALPADVAVMCAAVADWRPENPATGKTKKAATPATLTLIENPDILAIIARHTARPRLVIGFAAETGNVVESAQAKRTRKGADWIVANDVSINDQGQSVMGGDTNRIHLIAASGVEDWPEMSKTEVAAKLVARIIQELKGAA